MHLNWKTSVSVPEYADTEMNAALQRKIRSASDDDLLASLLHFAEGRVALSRYRGFDGLLSELRREEVDAGKLESDDDSPLCFEYRRANHRLLQSLRGEATRIETAVNQIGGVWHSLREASTGNLSRRYQQPDAGGEFELDAISSLERDLTPARNRLTAVLIRHREEVHTLALKDAEFRAFAATPDSISLEQFDRMTPLGFEQAVAELAQRDGYTLAQRNGGARDLGADVIATAPDGRKIVFQCKHRQPGGRPLGSPVIQTLNGTARPVHKADVVIAVTNASFTGPAHDLAAKQDIHLLFGPRLRKWATWGVPLLTVLGIETDIAQEAA
ncbi:restriction endonuclease [Streptomyces sp. NPDC091217]|uniref:restriction endonuclease n=1 Tax=Streptomyces sp. NPDC091217 TaxID=3365975 RepID=UPI003800CE00